MRISMGFLAAAATAVLFLATAYATASTVHDDLKKYGLPPGLLPDTVVSYSVDSNGDFEVALASPCYVKFAELVYYDKRVKGRLSYGSITNLMGIEVKKLFAWIPLTGIVTDSHGTALEFQSGFLSEKLPFSIFETIPHCRGTVSYRGSGSFLAEKALRVSEVSSDFFVDRN